MKKSSYDILPFDLKIRLATCIVLILFIILFRYYPVTWIQSFQDRSIVVPEQITIDLVDITVQRSQIPPPPRPRVPVVHSSDFFISDVDIDELIDLEFNYSLLERPPGTGSGNPSVVLNPQRAPRVQRIVEPVSPDLSITAQITALLTIDPSGRVIDVEIQTIRIFNPLTRQFEIADSIATHFLEATEYAAYQWVFRPALQNNQPVTSVSEHVFVFGRGIN